MRLLALNAGFANLGGRGVAARDFHSTGHPLPCHMDDIVGVEMTKTSVPNVNASLGSQVVSDQCSLWRIFALGGKRVEDRDVSRFGDGKGSNPYDIEASTQVALAGNSLVLVEDGASLPNKLHLRAALGKVQH